MPSRRSAGRPLSRSCASASDTDKQADAGVRSSRRPHLRRSAPSAVPHADLRLQGAWEPMAQMRRERGSSVAGRPRRTAGCWQPLPPRCRPALASISNDLVSYSRTTSMHCSRVHACSYETRAHRRPLKCDGATRAAGGGQDRDDPAGMPGTHAGNTAQCSRRQETAAVSLMDHLPCSALRHGLNTLPGGMCGRSGAAGHLQGSPCCTAFYPLEGSSPRRLVNKNASNAPLQPHSQHCILLLQLHDGSAPLSIANCQYITCES